MSTDPRVGTEIVGHLIESVIGRGGSSVVYLAEHVRLGRKVALKLLAPELSEDAGFRKRFIRESRAAAELDHPNIVRVYDAGEADGTLYISMQYIEGTDLARLLRRDGRLDTARVASIATQCAQALDAAHAKGLIHRDVKPANILVAGSPGVEDRFFLSDFGITKRLTSSGAITRTGEFLGTIDYIAPEQILGQPVDGRTDVYSLGCVLFECLTGKPPFERENDVAIVYAHLGDAPPRISEGRPDLPAGLDGVFARAMAKSKEARFPTCGRFAEGVRSVLSPPSPTLGPSRGLRGARRRRARALSVALVIALLAATAITVSLVSSGGPGSGVSTTSSPSGATGLLFSTVANQPRAFGRSGRQEMLRAAANGSAIIAVGYRASGRGNFDAAIWRSVDGMKWQAERPNDFKAAGNQVARGVVAWGSGFVVVGSDRVDGRSDVAVWRSTDGGLTWENVDMTYLASPHDQEMRRVAVIGSDLVAVGFDTADGRSDAAVWTSSDGLDWREATAEVLGGKGDQEARTLALSGDTLVIAGSSTVAGNRDAAVWVRANGTWTSSTSASLKGPGDQHIDDVIAGGPGFIATGRDGSTAAIWVSSDGLNWDLAGGGDTVFGGAGSREIFAVAPGGPGYVAIGTKTLKGVSTGAVWTSIDGTTWSRLPPTRIEALTFPGKQQDLIAYGDELVVVGRGRHADAEVWIASPAPASS